MTWTEPANSGPAIKFYEAFYRVFGGAWEDTGHTDTGLTVTVSGLVADTRYEVWVRAVTGDGVGPWSAIATATTTAVPSPGVTVSARALTVNENGSATYTLVLDTRPTAAVTIAVATGERRRCGSDGESVVAFVHGGRLEHSADGDGKRRG